MGDLTWVWMNVCIDCVVTSICIFVCVLIAIVLQNEFYHRYQIFSTAPVMHEYRDTPTMFDTHGEYIDIFFQSGYEVTLEKVCRRRLVKLA